jgi:hypothetical protein
MATCPLPILFRIPDFARIKRCGRNISPRGAAIQVVSLVLSAENPVAPWLQADDIAGPELPLPRRDEIEKVLIGTEILLDEVVDYGANL